jgi:hypothetical protein
MTGLCSVELLSTVVQKAPNTRQHGRHEERSSVAQVLRRSVRGP